ncbi:MAG: SRPBCC family protein [Acidimicrobiia bacterium]
MAPKNQRFWLTSDEVSTVIDAPADQLYDMVADMPRMGEWSRECATVEWLDGATGPAAGARFVGHNHTGPRGVIKWSRQGTVLVAERGREFAFATEEGGVEGTTWRYRFEPVDGGTRVTESYTVDKIPVWARIMDVPLNRHGDLLKNMADTLARMKAAAEVSTRAADTA